MQPKLKVVIDTNVFISAYLNTRGHPARIIDLWIRGAFDLYLSDEILDEYLRVLVKIGIAPPIVRLLNRRISKYSRLIRPAISITKIKNDPSDNKFLECAVVSKADFIISGDRHLLELGNIEDVKIVTPVEFLKFISG